MTEISAARVLTILGAEGEMAATNEARRFFDELRGEKLKRPTRRTCQCLCGCIDEWKDQYNWLHSLGSCPRCQELPHQQLLLAHVIEITGA